MKIQMTRSHKRQSGFSIPEVMIAIAIFAIGMLALGFLQTSLTRSQADANARVVATNIAERLLEQAKGFSVLGNGDGTATTGAFAYNEITEANISALVGSPTLGGVQYTVAPNVLDYRWTGTAFTCYQGEFNNAGDTRCVTGNAPAGSGSYSDFKLVELTVNWTGAEFSTTQGVATTDRLGSGSITLGSFISSVTSPTSAKVQTGSGGSVLPPIAYTPNTDPGVIPLALGDNRLKESTLPEPTVSNTLGQTTWDVITYVSGDNGSSFRRREEFRTVACSCEFAASGSANEPVVWAGDEYTDGAQVTKVKGISTDSNRFCERCCEDHHDSTAGSAGYQQYSPFRTDRSGSGNHKHYNFDTTTGQLVEVTETAGNAYLESCRMVRAGGYFRVAQDLRAEQQFMVPQDWLVTTSEIADYSSYLTGTDGDGSTDSAIEEFVDSISANNSGYPTTLPTWAVAPTTPSLPTYGAASPTVLAAGEFPVWTSVTNLTTNQLRSRAFYVDYMTPDLLAVIDCLEGSETVDEVKAKNGCSVGSNIGVGSVVLDQFPTNNALEVMPFFEVQLTGLNVWSATTPIAVTSEAIASNGAYSRGLASATADATRDVTAQMRKSNNGLLDVTKRVPDSVEPLMVGTLAVVASGSGVTPPPPPTGATTLSGGISLNQGLKSQNMSVAVTGSSGATNCSASLSAGWSCDVADFSVSPTVTIQYEVTGAGNCMSSDTAELGVAWASGVAVISLSTLSGTAPVATTQPLSIRKSGC